MNNAPSPTKILLQMLKRPVKDAVGVAKKVGNFYGDKIEGAMRAKDEMRARDMSDALASMGKTPDQYEADLGDKALFDPPYAKALRPVFNALMKARSAITNQ